MALLPAYAVNGGRVPAEMLRMMAWVSTSGAKGVATPTDLKVSALTVPGAGVNLNAGGAIIPTNYTGSTSLQSYAVANDQAVTVPVPGTGGSSRTSYIILRVSDPQYGGDAPSNPLTALYVEAVHVTTLSQTAPFIALAKIVMPASTNAVTNAMITDLRAVATPRKDRHLFAYDLGPGDALNGNEQWPNAAAQTVFVPEWATQAHMVTTYSQVLVPAGSTRSGFLWGQLGSIKGRTVGFAAPDATSASRQTYVAAGGISVPASMRGTTVAVEAWGNSTGGSGGSLLLDGNSAVVFDIEFREVAV